MGDGRWGDSMPSCNKAFAGKAGFPEASLRSVGACLAGERSQTLPDLIWNPQPAEFS